jgi:hypothetical protein
MQQLLKRLHLRIQHQFQHQTQKLKHRRKDQTVQNNSEFIYTEEQLMARLKFFIGVCLALTLTGIVFVVLYSIIFVTQPLNAISPIDQKFFELIIPIATFLTGTLSGIMLSGHKKEDQDAMLAAQKQALANAESAKSTIALTAPPAPVAPVSLPVVPKPVVVAPVSPVAPAPVVDTPPAPPVVGFNGKLAPPPAPQPEI